MPRRKQITIQVKELSVYYFLINELSKNPLLKDYDLDTVKLTILKKKPPPRIKDVERAIESLKWYVSAHSDRIEVFMGQQVIIKKNLAKMMRISRPTLDKWIRDGFIKPIKIDSTLEIFPVDAVLEQLEKQYYISFNLIDT
jgi:hypothetical protein